MAGTYNLTMRQNTAWSVTVEVADASGSPLALAGAAVMLIRRSSGSTARIARLATDTGEIGVTSNKVTARLSAAATAALPAGHHTYALYATVAGVVGVALLEGTLTVAGQAGQASAADPYDLPLRVTVTDGSVKTGVAVPGISEAPSYVDAGASVAAPVSALGRTLAKLRAGTAIKIAFVGDSGLEGNTVTTPGTDDAASLFCTELGARFGVTVTKSNRAVSGTTAGFALAPGWQSPTIFGNAISDAADVYVISFGHNDIRSDLASPGTGFPLAASLASIEHMVRRIRTAYPLAEIIISGEWPYTDTATASNAALNPQMAALKQLAAYYGCEFVDLAGALTALGVGGGDATVDATYIWPSAATFGQHMNSAGHRVWADQFLAKFPATGLVTPLPAVSPLPAWLTYNPDTIDTDWVSKTTGRSLPDGTPGWRQSGAWSPINAGTPSTSSTAGNSIVCQFDGPECFLRLDTGAGQGVVTINVDGRDLYSNLDLSTAGSGQTRIPIVGLARGVHNVQITVVSGSVTWRGLDCRSGSAVSIIDPSNAGITYTGAGWQANSTSPSAWNNVFKQSTTIGDSFGFSFFGTAFGLQIIRYVAVHQVAVTVDGVASTVDASIGSPGGVLSGVVLKSGLTLGTHTVSVASSGARNLNLGAIFWW